MASLLLLLVIVILVGALITGIILWSTSGSGSGESGEMSCGACGYAVRGLSQLNCPECGVDLRQAGIGRSGNPGKKRAGILLTFGSLGVCLLFVLASFWLLAVDSSPVSVPATQSLPATPQPPIVSPATPNNLPVQPVEPEEDEPAVDEDAGDAVGSP